MKFKTIGHWFSKGIILIELSNALNFTKQLGGNFWHNGEHFDKIKTAQYARKWKMQYKCLNFYSKFSLAIQNVARTQSAVTEGFLNSACCQGKVYFISPGTNVVGIRQCLLGMTSKRLLLPGVQCGERGSFKWAPELAPFRSENIHFRSPLHPRNLLALKIICCSTNSK